MTALVVRPANVSESAAAKLVLTKAKAAVRTLGKIWADGGYQQGGVDWAQAVGGRSWSAHEAALFDIDARFGDVMPVDEVLAHLREPASAPSDEGPQR